MKFVMNTLVLLATFSSATFAATPSFESEVGADVMIRQVLDQRLLQNGDAQFSPFLERRLQGSAGIQLLSLNCEAAGGRRACEIRILSQPEGTPVETTFGLNVTIFQGNVTAANITVP